MTTLRNGLLADLGIPALKRLTYRLLLPLLLVTTGCSLLKLRAELPSKRQLVRGQLTIHSDFYLPQQHRLIENLVSLRQEVTSNLDLPTSDEPIHVYLFENEKRFREFVRQRLTNFPDRRAFFIKNDTRLMVIAYWGERIAEDLRHEVTHGYLHAVVPAIPLWLDEGLAEYFEIQPGLDSINQPHIRLLAEAYRQGQWKPDLARLETIGSNEDLTQLEYAEAWLWVHFLLKTDAYSNQIVCETLRQIRENGSAPAITPQLDAWIPDSRLAVIQHLKQLADSW